MVNSGRDAKRGDDIKVMEACRQPQIAESVKGAFFGIESCALS